jgi:predicted alpha/beta-fold hydrolase
MARLFKWCWRRPVIALALVLLVAFLILNLLAYQHAHALTHYQQTGPSSRSREVRSVWDKARLLLRGVQICRPKSPAVPAQVGLPFENHTLAGSAGALDCWYIPSRPARGTVLIFHGYGGCKANMLPEAKAFHEMGYGCLLVDFRGCGGSDGDTTTIGFHEAEDVVAAVANVRERWPGSPVLLFGQSMGAAAALRAVVAYRCRSETRPFCRPKCRPRSP